MTVTLGIPKTPTTSITSSSRYATRPVREPRHLIRRDVALMGGRVGVHLEPLTTTREAVAAADATLRRLAVWTGRLTRFSPDSELSHLNVDPRAAVPVGPTLAAVLDWSRQAEQVTDGIVDIGLLEARLAAEAGDDDRRGGVADDRGRPHRSLASRAWSMERRPRGALVHRPIGLRFDLDGVAKG